MKVSKLLAILSGVPDEAEVYIESDHFQLSEQAGGVLFTTQITDLPYYGEDIHWIELKPDNITAILIH